MKPLLRSCALILVVLLLSAPSLNAGGNESAKSPANDPVPAKREKQKENTTAKTSKTQRKATPPSEPPKVVSNPTTEKKQNPPTENPKEPEKYSFWPTIGSWPDWLLILVGAGTIAVAWRTLGVLKAQADATRDAAGAALEEAKAITLSEQAYVFAKVELDGYADDGQERVKLHAKTWFINHGKTPAIIINMTGVLQLTGAGVSDVPHKFPETPSDDRQFSEGWVIASISQSPEGMKLPVELSVAKPDIEEIRKGAKKIYCVGWIKYKDILGNQRETGYCWEYLQTPSARFKFCYASQLNYCK